MTKNTQFNLMYSILCDNATVDTNGKAVIFGTFNTIFSQTFPCTHPAMYLVTGWTHLEGEHTQKIVILKPNKEKMGEIDNMKFKALNPSTITHLQAFFGNLPFETEGTYSVEVYLDGDLYQVISLHLQKINPKPATIN